MGQHHAKTVDRDITGPIPIATLLKASQEDSHGEHEAEDDVSQFEAPKTWALDVFDRALRTGVQSGVAWIGTAQAAGQGVTDAMLYALAGVVGASVLLSVLTSLISAPSFDNSWWFQVLERAVKTFAQNLLAGWGVMEVANNYLGGFPADFTTILTSAAVAAVTSTVMSVITTNIGNTDTVDIGTPSGP